MSQSKSTASMDSRRPNQLLYAMVRDRILAHLATSGLQPGDRYFTEGELAERFEVSRNTIRRAMADLEGRGYLQRQRGLGSVVQRLPGASNASTSTAPSVNPPRQTNTSAERRLIVVLPFWDDSTEGFYAARILGELTNVEGDEPWIVEVRHPNDALELSDFAGAACFVMDPGHATVLRLAELVDHGLRVVTAAAANPLPFAVNLCDDTHDAVQQAVQQFHQLGHTRIGLLVHDLSHHDYREALHGYIDAHRLLNLPIHPHAIVQFFKNQDSSPPELVGIQAITAWVVTFSGGINLLARTCRQVGLSIPADVSVIGLDDPSDHHIGSLGRQLSVIRADPAATAQTLRACLTHWDDDMRGQTITVPMQRIDRETVAPPRNA